MEGETMPKELTRAAQKAKDIRTELKRRWGYTGKDVSVTCDNYSMGSSVAVELKAVSIPLTRIAEIEAIAKGAESIRRCSYSGEILSGGNRYLHFRYADAFRAHHAARWVDQIVAACKEIADVGATDHDHSVGLFAVAGDDEIATVYGPHSRNAASGGYAIVSARLDRPIYIGSSLADLELYPPVSAAFALAVGLAGGSE